MSPAPAAPEPAPPGGWPEHLATPAGKPRARSLGLPLAGRPGRWNAITDVPGVEAGYLTLTEGESVRTGVTAIHPRGRDGAGDPVTAGVHAQNGNGEMTGTAWIAESGTFAGPVAITNTHAVGAGSVIVVVATDAPLLPGQCQALARRVTIGLARTGTAGSHFSGDLFLAFSTGNAGAFPAGAAALSPAEAGYSSLRFIGWPFLDPFFTAVAEATEEAVLNALIANEDMTGRDGHCSPALPRAQLAGLLRGGPLWPITDERGSGG